MPNGSRPKREVKIRVPHGAGRRLIEPFTMVLGSLSARK
jgi:hypothetical protein